MLTNGYIFDLRAAIFEADPALWGMGVYDVDDLMESAFYDDTPAPNDPYVWATAASSGAGLDMTTATDFSKDEWHDFQIVYDLSGDGGSGLWSAFIDGSPAWTRTRAQVQDSGDTDTFYWFNGGSSDWIVSLARVTEVPEPGTWTLLLLGMCGMGLLRRRR